MKKLGNYIKSWEPINVRGIKGKQNNITLKYQCRFENKDIDKIVEDK